MHYWKHKPGITSGVIGDYLGKSKLSIECVCDHGRTVDPAALSAPLTLDMPIAELRRRAKCNRCDNRMTIVIVAPDWELPNNQPRMTPGCFIGYSTTSQSVSAASGDAAVASPPASSR